MKLKKALPAGVLLICLSLGTYFAVTNANEFTKEQKKETYNKVRSEFVQKQEDIKKQIKENPEDPKLEEKLKDLKQDAMTVNALAKEVDTDAYYRNDLKSFLHALEGTIADETIMLENKKVITDDVKLFKKVVEDKKKLLEECKKVDIASVKNPQQVYEDWVAKVLKITSQME